MSNGQNLNRQYIGDGVYVERWELGVRLTTEDGISVQNEIFLEGQVVEALVNYLRDIGR